MISRTMLPCTLLGLQAFPGTRLLFNLAFLGLLCSCIVLLPHSAAALNGTLTFDPSTSPEVTGYKVYYGTASRVYDHTLDIGNATQHEITGLEPDTTYYFAVTAYDASGNESDYSEELTVNTETVNTLPSAADDTASTTEDTSVQIYVLANDTDDDGDVLQITNLTTPAHGQADIMDEGVMYTPDQDYYGSDSFTYTITDGKNGTANAQVTVTISEINDPPQAVGDSAVTSEDSAVDIPVLANDSDRDGDSLSIYNITAPAHGLTEIVDSGIRYTPEENYNGDDAFSYTISDGRYGTDSAQVNVSIEAVNDSPIAGDVSVTTSENTAIDIPVLQNDTDIDGDELTIASVTRPEHGTAQISESAITYTPDEYFHGYDVCNYTVSDGQGGSDTAAVSISVKSGVVPPQKLKMKYK